MPALVCAADKNCGRALQWEDWCIDHLCLRGGLESRGGLATKTDPSYLGQSQASWGESTDYQGTPYCWCDMHLASCTAYISPQQNKCTLEFNNIENIVIIFCRHSDAWVSIWFDKFCHFHLGEEESGCTLGGHHTHVLHGVRFLCIFLMMRIKKEMIKIMMKIRKWTKVVEILT